MRSKGKRSNAAPVGVGITTEAYQAARRSARSAAVIAALTGNRGKGTGQTSRSMHFHDKHLATKEGHDPDDPHAVTGPIQPAATEEVSARPVPPPYDWAKEDDQYTEAGTHGQSMTMQYNYNPVPEYTQSG